MNIKRSVSAFLASLMILATAVTAVSCDIAVDEDENDGTSSSTGSNVAESEDESDTDTEISTQIDTETGVDTTETGTEKITEPYIENSPFENANMNFSVELFKEVTDARKNNDSIIISPLSVMIALAMTANGASGETLEDMEEVLGMPRDRLNEALKSYVASLPSADKYKLMLANSIWMRDKGLTVEEKFLEKVYAFYASEPYAEPFDATTVDKINAWVDENTDGMINKLIDGISDETMLYIINAVCFDAMWSEPYDDRQVRDGEFANATGEVKSVKMMHSEEKLYIENDDAVGFIKNYRRGYSFVAILPKDATMPIYDYIDSLDPEELRDMIDSSESIRVNAALPQFKCEYTVRMDQMLIDMGMDNCFVGQGADFSAIGSSDRGPLAISQVLHKTYIDVTQYGTRAAAVTSVAMDVEGEVVGEVKNVTLDRPFVYMIIDNSAKLPIFMGAVTDIDGDVIGQRRYLDATMKEYIRVDDSDNLEATLASISEVSDGETPYLLIDSTEELSKLTEALEGDDVYFGLDSYRELETRLDEEFFSENRLVVFGTVEISGSICHRVDACYINETRDPAPLVVELCSIEPWIRTDDMAGWLIFVAFPKDTMDLGGGIDIRSYREWLEYEY